MKNRLLIIVSMVLLTAGNAAAQHFEWVRGYAPGDNVAIVGSVTDSVGNLYILGNINFNTCWENGSRLLPIAPYGHASDDGDVLIAKVSPEGDLVWHKVIHGNLNGRMACDIKSIGDTAFACLVEMSPATREYYLYYLDTMIYETSRNWDHNSPYSSIPFPDYPINVDGFTGYEYLALITFDFDGHVLEQHFLQMSYLDYNGEDITCYQPAPYNATWISCKAIAYASFAVDEVGNIYLCRNTYDMIGGCTAADEGYSVDNGTISAVKFWCDRREVGVVPADSTLNGSPQILKFSPHFDTLLNARYVYQTRNTPIICIETKLTHHAPHIYARFRLEPNLNQNLIVFDSTNAITTRLDYVIHAEKDVIIKYDSSLAAVNSIIIEDTITNPATFSWGTIFSLLNDIVFDSDSNLAIISCSATKSAIGDTSLNEDNSYFVINGNIVDFHRNAGIIIMDEETLDLKHTGQLSTSNQSLYYVTARISSGNLFCFNNRIFTQASFYGEARFPNQVFQAPPMSTHGGVCLGVFDYEGNLIKGIDYHTSSLQYTGGINMKDSVLYLMNLLSSGATFGDISVPSRGEYFACIAKYTDPAFMQPYRPVNINTVDAAPVTVYPNPATDRVHVTLPGGESVTEAYVVTLSGQRRRVPVGGHTVDLSTVPAGILFLQIVTNNHIYTTKIIKL